MKNSIPAVVILATLPSSAPALDAYLQRDLGVKNFTHYCEYSDGNVYTVESTDLCPLSVDAGNGLMTGGGNMGFLKGEYKERTTKICVYDVLGEKKFVRFDFADLCPLSLDF